MDFKEYNDEERNFYRQDFSVVKDLLDRVRSSLCTGKPLSIKDLSLKNLVDYDNKFSFAYITLFQAGLKPLRWGACRTTLEETLNRDIDKLRSSANFTSFDISDIENCRIMFEYITEQTPTRLQDICYNKFSPSRFEPGITGIKINLKGNSYIYMPNDAWVFSQMDLKQVLNTILRKTYIKDITNKISERIDILKRTPHECYIIKSRAFVTYKDGVMALYRGNDFYEYSPEEIKRQAISGADWNIKYQQEDGKFLYYYDAKEDNYVDHEHPKRPENDLYYNDLRHCGGIVTQIRAYQLTKDEKYLDSAKKAIDFITTLTKEHDWLGETAGYVFYNDKAKLGGTGMILIAMMKYRTETGDKSYDEYIKKYVRHLLSRIYKTGEFMGYYIHPEVQKGRPLVEMTDEERFGTFSFYYPGEALLGLALFANYFKDDDNLRAKVLEKSRLALDWIVDERPKIYSELFTALPSDAWLMQAIEEWASNPDFRKDNYINFVFNDAKTMMSKMYKKDDSPYLDYEGSYYYNYGDHFYPDGSRSEGLIGAYYLAKKLGKEDFAQELLEACRRTAQSQMILFNTDRNVYAHKNPEKSKGAIRFKATRQWIRVDSIQHVACFYLRLYFAEMNISVS